MSDNLPDSNNPPATIDPTTVSFDTKNVLDHHGSIIGTLSLPSTTSEQYWSLILTYYAAVAAGSTTPDSLNTTFLSATGSVTTSSASAVTVSGMTVKPSSGSYLAFFNGSVSTNGASAAGQFGLYVDGVLISETKRDISCNLQLLGGLVSVSLNTIAVGTYTGGKITLDGSQTLDLKYRSTNGGTIGFLERTLMLIKVN